VNLDPATQAHLRVAVRAHIRQLRRNAVPVPAGLLDFIRELEGCNEPSPDPAAQTRVLTAERVRRYRARRRGQDVPKRRPGPQKIVTG
jgi:hypothetical protein